VGGAGRLAESAGTATVRHYTTSGAFVRRRGGVDRLAIPRLTEAEIGHLDENARRTKGTGNAN